MREELANAVATAIANSQPPPTNEVVTCNRIIYPLLLAVGYGHLEIGQQDADAARGKADYTILPDSPDHTWFLEAKAWNVTLDDNHANQAINYANTQGKRWVVLSNGRQWRLYDNHTIGTADVKLACVAELDSENFSGFLESISKASITQGKLEDYVRNQRLYTCLGGQITKPDSEIVKGITKILRGVAGLSSVGTSDVVGFFRNYAAGSPAPEEKSAPEKPAPPAPPAEESAPPKTYPLGSITTLDIKGTKPKALVLPNGTAVSVTGWNDLVVKVATYVLEQGQMPEPPLFAGSRAKSPLVARSNSAGRELMREPKALPAPFEDWVVEGHYSANDHQGNAARILSAAGIVPGTLGIVI